MNKSYYYFLLLATRGFGENESYNSFLIHAKKCIVQIIIITNIIMHIVSQTQILK